MVKNSKIKKVKAREILDSKGSPTLEVKLETDFGEVKASVPSGVSIGTYEATNLETKKAVENVEKIIGPAIESEELVNQKKIDQVLIELDGTQNKSRLGANAILAVSIAVCRVMAKAENLPLYQYLAELTENSSPLKLPKPSFNMIEGGKHAVNGPAFQEFMVIPQKRTFKENLDNGNKVYRKLGDILKDKFKEVKLSSEGAFSAPIKEISEAFDLILEASEKSGEKNDIRIAIDVAASEFFEKGNYKIDGKYFSKEELMDFYSNLIEKYPIISIEDPFQEEDFKSFSELQAKIGERVLIFGDDLTVSNVKRINLAKEDESCAGLILKPNQIGTVSETLEAVKLAKSYGWKIMVANRAGETEDDFIADLAVGLGAEFIKSGAPFPKERMAKYNRLVKIEEELRSAG